MKKSLLALATLSIICFFSCNKINSDNTSVIDNGIKSTLINWIDTKKNNTSDAGQFIDSLKNMASWNTATISSINKLEYMIFVPFNYNNNKNGLVFILRKVSNKIETGYFVDIALKNNSKFEYNSNPEKILTDFYSYHKNEFSGSIKAFTFNNSLMWEMGYTNGNNTYMKKVMQLNYSTSNNSIISVSNNSIGSAPIKRQVDGCTYYYLVTFWSDGTVDREFIGTICDPGTGCAQTVAISKDSSIKIKSNCTSENNGGVSVIDTMAIHTSNPCLSNMINSITQKSLIPSISNTFNSIFGVNNDYNVSFEQSSTMADTIAKTSIIAGSPSVGGMDIKITLNVNILQGASQEYIAETIFHEMLHAIIDDLYPTIHSEFCAHQTIAENYIDAECTALQSIFPYLTTTDATAMILSGLGQLNDMDPTYYSALVGYYGLTTDFVISRNNDYKTLACGNGCVTKSPQN